MLRVAGKGLLAFKTVSYSYWKHGQSMLKEGMKDYIIIAQVLFSLQAMTASFRQAAKADPSVARHDGLAALSPMNRLDSFSYRPGDDFRLRQYQHPEYLMHHKRYREEFDYYSVGMILLEIGLWNALSTLTKSKSNRFQGLSDEQFRREIIARRVPELRIAMGTGFMEATRTCLEGGFVGRSRDLGTEWDALYLSFKSLVMDRIPLIG